MGLIDFIKNKSRNKAAPNAIRISGNVRLHPDLEGLVWIGDGKFKNYNDNQNNTNSFEVDGIVFTTSLGRIPSRV